jgi:GDP/UDP-N,N'-diacetylbacillosamine 2-epimerase (hydrolysing)
MGEEDWRIHQVGAPQLDQLVQTDFLPSERKVLDKLSLAMGEYVLICFHSTTEQIQESLKFAEELLNIIYNKKLEVLWILPNNDPGSLKISQLITKNNNKKIKIFSNLTREEYLIALKNCRVIIGNSSSGILEAPTFKIPALNLGTRQRNRTRSKNVLDCVEVQSLNSSLERILSLDFKKNLDNLTNPYGDGHSVQRILDLVLSIDLKSEKLVVKGMSY